MGMGNSNREWGRRIGTENMHGEPVRNGENEWEMGPENQKEKWEGGTELEEKMATGNGNDNWNGKQGM